MAGIQKKLCDLGAFDGVLLKQCTAARYSQERLLLLHSLRCAGMEDLF